MQRKVRNVYTLCCFVTQDTAQGLLRLKDGNITNKKCLGSQPGALKASFILTMSNEQKFVEERKPNSFRFSLPFGRMLLVIIGLIAITTIVMQLSGCSSLSMNLKILGSEIDLRKGECSFPLPPE